MTTIQNQPNDQNPSTTEAKKTGSPNASGVLITIQLILMNLVLTVGQSVAIRAKNSSQKNETLARLNQEQAGFKLQALPPLDAHHHEVHNQYVNPNGYCYTTTKKWTTYTGQDKQIAVEASNMGINNLRQACEAQQGLLLQRMSQNDTGIDTATSSLSQDVQNGTFLIKTLQTLTKYATLQTS